MVEIHLGIFHADNDIRAYDGFGFNFSNMIRQHVEVVFCEFKRFKFDV